MIPLIVTFVNDLDGLLKTISGPNNNQDMEVDLT